MSINLTLLGQAITFLLFVIFTMKFVWPPIIQAMQERQKKIADGLAAGARGEEELANAEVQIQQQMREVRIQASEIIEKAYKRADQIIEEAKDEARKEGEHILQAAQLEITQAAARAREGLRKETVGLAMNSAERILQRSVDKQIHNDLLKQLEAEIV